LSSGWQVGYRRSFEDDYVNVKYVHISVRYCL
jgi:hypothetical protein